MKTFTCVICGEEVSKRKSFAFENGRACKTHQEAADATQERLDKEQADREAKAKAQEKRSHERLFGRPQQQLGWCKKHCWICEKEGFAPEEVPMRMLIALEKQRQKGDFNFFDVQAQREAAGFNEKTPLIDFKVETTELYDKLVAKCQKDMVPLLDMLRVARLCAECANKVGIDVKNTLQERAPKKVPNLKVLWMIGAAYEESDLAKDVKTVAALENEMEKRSDDSF